MTNLLLTAGLCAIAVVIAVSPTTVVSLALLAGIVTAICSRTSGAERRIVLWMLVGGIVLRFAAIGIVFLWSDPYHLASFPFDGDGRFLKLRSLWIRNLWLGVPINQEYYRVAFGEYGRTSYVYVLAYLQYLLGPAPYAIHLLSVCWMLGTAGLLWHLVRRSFGSTAALIVLALMLFLPTLFMWSVAAMRESWLWLLASVVLVGAERTIRSRRWMARAAWAGLVVVVALILQTTRAGGFVIAAGSFIVASIGMVVTRRPHVLTAAIVVVAAVAVIALQQPRVRDPLLLVVRSAALVHIGHVRTEGFAYKLLDQRFYSGDPIESMTWNDARRFMLRAWLSFLVVPLPWHAASPAQILFIPLQFLWYGLVLLALLGAVLAVRQDPLVAWLFIGLIVVSVAVMAPHEGNMGTLVRHRDGIVPFVGCLAAVAIASVLARIRDATTLLVADSAVVSLIRRWTGMFVVTDVAALRRRWRQSAFAVALAEVRATERYRLLRWAGATVLTGVLLSTGVQGIWSAAWPIQVLWAAAAGFAFLVVLWPHAFVCAWNDRHALLSAPAEISEPIAV